MRSFGLIFGGTTQAVAMVLAVYMAGLATGAARSCRAGASADPLLAYAKLEAADRRHGAPDAAAPARPALGLRPPWSRDSASHRLRRVGGDRDPRRLRAAAAHDPARRDGAARRRVPGAVGPRRSPGFRTPLPAEHARRRRGGGARSLRARSGAGSARNTRRRRGGQPVDRKRGAALGARHSGGRASPAGGAGRRGPPAPRPRRSELAFASGAATFGSRCCGRGRTRS
jgi:hypothetical protein